MIPLQVGMVAITVSDKNRGKRGKARKDAEVLASASAGELATGLDLYATSTRTEYSNILNLGGLQGSPSSSNLGPGNSGMSDVTLSADTTTEATIPTARAGAGQVPDAEHLDDPPRKTRKEVYDYMANVCMWREVLAGSLADMPEGWFHPHEA